MVKTSERRCTPSFFVDTKLTFLTPSRQRREKRRNGINTSKKQARHVKEEVLQRAENIADIARQAPSRSKKLFKRVS